MKINLIATNGRVCSLNSGKGVGGDSLHLSSLSKAADSPGILPCDCLSIIH